MKRKLSLLTFVAIFCLVQTAFIPHSFGSGVSLASLDERSPAPDPLDSPARTGDNPESNLHMIHDTRSFAVYSLLAGTVFPTLLGRIERVGSEIVLIPTLQIETDGDRYILTCPGDPNYLKVVERLAEGGMGRLLRYHTLDEEGVWIDMEFKYYDRESRIVIMDHAAGLFYQVAFNEKPRRSIFFFPRPDAVRKADELTATTSANKFTTQAGRTAHLKNPEVQRIHSRPDTYNAMILWLNRLVRGPPARGLVL